MSQRYLGGYVTATDNPLSSNFASNTAPTVVTTFLSLYLDAGNPSSYPGTGTTWFDISGNNRNGTLVNGTAYSADNGGVFVFDGTNDYVNVANSSLNHGTSNFTYACWVNLAAKPASGTIFENGSWTNCLLFRYETDGITLYSMNTYFGKFAFNPTLNTWNYLTFVRNGNTVTFYLNGVSSSSLAFGTSLNVNPSPNNLFIGSSQHTTGQYFNGRINLVTIYAMALTQDQITQNFNFAKSRYGL